MNGIRLLALFIAGTALTGCATIGNSEFKCNAPAGVHCQSVTATYLASLAGFDTPDSSAKSKDDPDRPAAAPASYGSKAPVLRTAVGGRIPLRSDPRLLRMWIKEWEDSDGDYHDQSYIYLPIDAGRWAVTPNRPGANQTYQGITAPAQRAADPEPAPTKSVVDPKEITQSATDFAKSFARPGSN